MWVVVGLGNPGSEYAGTRHNIGFDVVEELAQRAGVRLRRGTAEYREAEARLAGRAVLLVEPRTYVNRSGRALAELASAGTLALDELLVVVDDVALPFGRLRLRAQGSAGGHNGLRSIVETLGTDGFARLRIGVGAPDAGTDLADHVLGPFTAEERDALPDLVARGADAVLTVLELGVERAATRVNAPPAA